MMNDRVTVFNRDTADRYTLFPIEFPTLHDFYIRHLSTFWTVEEVSLGEDLAHWKHRLNDSERMFVKNVLAFFASSDGIVNENLVTNFYNEVQMPEARNFYAVQIMIEAIHGQQYSLLIDTYISDKNEKKDLFRAVETIPAVKKKANWAIKWMEDGHSALNKIPECAREFFETLRLDPSAVERVPGATQTIEFFTKPRPSLAQRLLAYVCVEGIFFSGSFCAIYWLKSRGLMPGLATANEFISRDENLHAEFAIELYNMLPNKVTQDQVHLIFKEAVEIEKEFITESLPVNLIGMNCNLMSQYIEYVADRWLVILGLQKIYGSTNPFGFMESIGMQSKSNFFEVRTFEYERSGVGHTEEDNSVGFDADF
jgi:ribonucleoside-diphosphate reductase beta chain